MRLIFLSKRRDATPVTFTSCWSASVSFWMILHTLVSRFAVRWCTLSSYPFPLLLLTMAASISALFLAVKGFLQFSFVVPLFSLLKTAVKDSVIGSL